MTLHKLLSSIGLTVFALLTSATAQDDLVQRGRQLLVESCSQCHSTDKTNPSPLAGAPAFREIDLWLDLDEAFDRLRTGLHSNYEDMPSVRFTRDDARAVVAYLRSIQAR